MLYIEQAVVDELINYVEPFPDERCGFLFGVENLEDRMITKVVAARNVTAGDSRRMFEIGAKDYLEAERTAVAENLSLIGIYHSHPGHAAMPSETDRQAAQPYFSYIILSVLEGKFDNMRSWRLNHHHQFEEEIINHS